MGIAMVWLYAAMRSGFGSGPKKHKERAESFSLAPGARLVLSLSYFRRFPANSR